MKRKIKFKDGTTGSFTPAQKPVQTFFQCGRGDLCAGGSSFNGSEVQPAYLNTEEYARGNSCAACLLSDKLHLDKKSVAEMKKKNSIVSKEIVTKLSNMLNFLPDISPLETKSINYIGLLYTVEIYNVKGVRFPCCKISNETEILYQSCSNIASKLGREIFMYCLTNKDENNFTLLPAKCI